jgi:hypothetical protein
VPSALALAAAVFDHLKKLMVGPQCGLRIRSSS